MKIENLRFKRVLRFDPYERKLRLFRVMWEANGGPGPDGYSAKVSLNLVPKLFAIKRETFDLRIALMGVQVHVHRSYGGYCT